ncbi:acetyl-CoA C-acyltransferase [Neobacillus thermocopriae]|uniref:Acetyl-CoA C-acyltransferase n=1 Tax=Neobacillus thermocopriae TaxID=1215031 RepID=A0A6B3TSZ8_9BACI|nr:acetyl-CoA C-acyltransferase [Neobacillus thermocopriae]MED3625134.1 acetyl-CoA C-acyltransferase [Neobacillus thermocopriae]MED3712811.1 acetyl-CoA C-acyltransferase [Neobacillus thermocopriae]NEX79466.1 acetyl-CoA C-acyltransferase [Neobacillus thermocopriae]
MKRAVIVLAKRTPIGKVKGILRDIQPHELVAPLLQYLANRLEDKIDDIILGNVVGPGGNIARVAALEAGLPLSVTGLTIDRQCSAGLEAIRMACYYIQGGAGCCYIAGGVESASTSPFPSRARFSPVQIGDPDMGVAAENVAEKYAISKELQDKYALLSYERTWVAYEKGYFTQEIIPIKENHQDEELLRKRKLETLLKRAKPIFKKNGTVTAANSCGIHDGASAVLVMEEKVALKHGYQPILRFLDSEVSAVHPNFPGEAPIPAIQALLKRNLLTVADIDLIEINEAFSSKIVACMKELSIPCDKINVHGGALTLGHPYGASGSILITRLFYEVQRRKNTKYVLAALGSAGGIGEAILFEVVT